MRQVMIAAALLAITTAVPTLSAGQGAQEEAAIRRVIQQRDAAWGKDAKAYAALFTEDADQLTSAGQLRRGRASIEKDSAAGWAEAYKGATETTSVETVRLITPDVAIADGTFQITNIPGGGTRKGRASYILLRTAGGWKIAAQRGMVPVPAGAAATSTGR
jgi:uncharacterized protein (TIGR02246 family)